MNDRELVESILNGGNTAAFSLLMKRYEGRVYSKALGITRQEEAAREVTQQTFIRVYQRLSDWRGSELGPWLTAIACHLSLNMLEGERRRCSIEGGELAEGRELTEGSGAMDGEDYSAEREERLQRMEEAIGRLSPDDQRLLRLHYYERVGTADIARRLGFSQSNILVRLHRIRERLKKLMQHERND